MRKIILLILIMSGCTFLLPGDWFTNGTEVTKNGIKCNYKKYSQQCPCLPGVVFCPNKTCEKWTCSDGTTETICDKCSTN
jgi:hypothetical protein